MTKAKTVLVTGGAGFIGSNVNKHLNEAGYKTIVLDDLSTGCREAVTRGELIVGDMGNVSDLEPIFEKYKIDVVMHFAASIDVGESVKDPAKYYHNNVVKTLVLLDTMLKHKIKSFVFSSSAATYGEPKNGEGKLSEDSPCNPVNPYGETKLIVEHILRDYAKAYQLNSCSLRYFNAAGGDPDEEVKNRKIKESNLIPVVLHSLLEPNGSVTVFGTDYPTPDGTCIRDYIHLYDLSSAHIAAIEHLSTQEGATFYNLGNGNGYSVLEVIAATEKVTNRKVNVIHGDRREGDPPVLFSDASKARKELGWKPQYPQLESMISDAWNAYRNQ